MADHSSDPARGTAAFHSLQQRATAATRHCSNAPLQQRATAATWHAAATCPAVPICLNTAPPHHPPPPPPPPLRPPRPRPAPPLPHLAPPTRSRQTRPAQTG